MYLKSIEIQGFKSFANRINFKFHDGITAIVGPNGSGKSNVADAVRWVLGEQRVRQLRGQAMQDVIFSGTQTRKALSYAYVAITFDNKDLSYKPGYDDVTVARRIYRSGESEYLLNGTPCRLKDISEMFYDTGIGKEGYSIIGQGQIDKILSAKPEERREMFDEAAGIVKFKRRKLAAQKKLEEEKLNRIRISDIITELERQSTPLEGQAEVARTYLRKREELRNLDIGIFLKEHARLSEQIAQAEEKHGTASMELHSSGADYEKIKQEYEEIEEKLGQIEEIIEKERQELLNTGLLGGKLEGEINVLKEQISAAQKSEEHLKKRALSVQGEIAQKTADKQALLANKADIDKRVSENEGIRVQKKADMQAALDNSREWSEKIEAAQNKMMEILSARATIKSKITSADTMLSQIEIRQEELASRLAEARSDEALQEAQIEQLRLEFAKINQEIERLNDAQADIEEKLFLAREDLAKKDRALRDMQVKYHQEKSRWDALQNMSERYEGYGGAVRQVMEQKGRQAGIVGVVADLIRCEAKYETAIETALGASIQHIVTQDEESAKGLIALLKKEKAGRATFLPLSALKNSGKFGYPLALKEAGAIDTADKLVQCDGAYTPVVESLLSRTLVTRNVDDAIKIARKYKQAIRIVTLEGELLTPGGAISGGSYKNTSNLLSRHRESEEAKQRMNKYLREIEELMQGMETTKANRNTLRLELEELKNELQKTYIAQNTARHDVSVATEKKEAAEAGGQSLMSEEKEIAEQMLKTQADKAAGAKELKDSEDLEQGMETLLIELQNSLEDARRAEAVSQAAASEQDVEAEKLLQQLLFHQQNMERMEAEMKSLAAELMEIDAAIIKNSTLLEEKQADIAAIQETIQSSHTQKGDSEQQLNAAILQKEALSKEQKKFFAKRESMAEHSNALDKEVYRLAAQKERLQEALSAQLSYMWEEYELTLQTVPGNGMAVEAAKSQSELSSMKRQIASLKEEIRALGDVNVNAIEDLRNILERYNFLKTQHDDLAGAEEVLYGIIAELDEAMRKQFNEKFTEIGREFDVVFKELFGGGQASLSLLDDEDILEAGIRIIAQPPGKKLQNMMQLSGGEKALTAIALIFAIQNLKPSPFCLLDEIESALDENNITRFAKYLKKLAKDTQFIVITHRRGTMEKSDRLYGITMQEKGVSALVSVKLVENELE